LPERDGLLGSLVPGLHVYKDRAFPLDSIIYFVHFTFVTQMLHVYLHHEPQVRLICSWCMRICLRRAAHINVERLISVQTDMQTDIDMERNVDIDMGVKSVYIRAFGPREIKSINKSF